MQRQRADEHAHRANTVADDARTSELATLARTLPASRVDLALLLGLESRRRQASIETDGALETALAHTPPGLERVLRLDSPTLSASVAPDGRLLAVPRSDGSVRVLSLPALEVVRVLRGRNAPAAVARFSDDGSQLVVGGVGGLVHVWNVATGRLEGKPLRTRSGFAFGFVDPAEPTRVFTVTADGKNGKVRLWDRRDPEQPRDVGRAYRFDVERGQLPVAAISGDGSLLAAGSTRRAAPGTTTIFDVQTHAALHQLAGPPGLFLAGTHTLTTAQSEQIMFWDAASGRPDREPITGFNKATTEQSVSVDGRLLAVRDQDRGIRVFDIQSRTQVGAPLGLETGDIPIGFVADGRLLTSGSGVVGIWRLGVTAPPFTVGLSGYPPGRATIGKVIPGSNDVITVAWCAAVCLEPLLRWDSSTGAAQGPVVNGEARAFFSTSPDGRYLVAPRLSAELGFGNWNLETGERLAVFGDAATLPALAYWSPSGDTVATGSNNERFIVVWDLSNPSHPVRRHELKLGGRPPPRIDDFVVIPYWSWDGRLIAAVDQGRDDQVMVFDVDSGRKIWTSPRLTASARPPSRPTAERSPSYRPIVALPRARSPSGRSETGIEPAPSCSPVPEVSAPSSSAAAKCSSPPATSLEVPGPATRLPRPVPSSGTPRPSTPSANPCCSGRRDRCS